jgi:peptide/nickel transport system permease protein
MTTDTSKPGAASKAGFWKRWRDSDIWWSFTHSKSAMIAAVVLAVLLITAIFAPLFAPQNPYDAAQLDMWKAELPPVWQEGGEWPYLLGTDTQGRDMLSAILYGTRISIVIGLASVALSLLIGMTAGLVAGFFGGFIENLLMRIGDITLSIPTILIAILVSAVVRQMLPSDLREIGASAVLVLAIALSSWVQYARTVRAQTIVERNKEYVQAARLLKVPARRILAHHPAQHADPGAGCGDAEFRHGDPHRGDPVLPWHRHAAGPTVAGHADPHRQSVPVLRLVVDRAVSGDQLCTCSSSSSTFWATGCGTYSIETEVSACPVCCFATFGPMRARSATCWFATARLPALAGSSRRPACRSRMAAALLSFGVDRRAYASRQDDMGHALA